MTRLGGVSGRRRRRVPRTAAERRRRRLVVVVAGLLAVLLLPVPWTHVVEGEPWGAAWRLNGRLMVDGEVVDPPGRWSWLTVGRPAVVGELLHSRLVGDDDGPRDMRDAPRAARPAMNEPLAAAVGLAHAGHDLEFGLIVEAIGPESPDYPDHAIVVELNGIELTDRAAWWEASARSLERVAFRTADGQVFTAPGPGLPYAKVHVADVPPDEVQAAVAGRLARMAPVGWFRNLALGRSHGLMVALTTYAHAVDHDLADGRHIAGTGGIRADGSVARIGGLPAKATAARRAGVDVLFFPATQAGELDGFDPDGMELVPVLTLGEAIAYLEARAGSA